MKKLLVITTLLIALSPIAAFAQAQDQNAQAQAVPTYSATSLELIDGN